MKRRRTSRPAAAAQAKKLLARLRRGDDVRRNAVARVRDSLRNGTYENDLKMQVAMDRLMEELQ